MVQAVPETINFPKEEERILQYWTDIDAFQTSLKLSKGRPRYTFYDGPPFATGLPHYGHILAGTVKDIVTRYAHQTNHYVERRFGWDCHGLPVEYEIDKSLKITGPADVMKMGIKQYNNECRKIVMRYATDWETIITRLGRWIDFKNDYKTLYPSFMESVWWVFKQLYDKGLVYKGFKVMPFSTACNTPLSNFESGQNYKEVVDPAVIVSFPLDEDPAVSLVAWTTTPWTLPSNMSVCVNEEKDYVKVQDNANKHIYIMMEARLESLFKKPEDYTILDRFKGETLKGKTYQPLFSYFAARKATGAFQVLCDGYVTEESGTGVVHQAPYFGEDDYRVCLAAGIITKDGEIVCPVDANGCFEEIISDFKGKYVKDADKHIIKLLESNGRLVHQGMVKHNYPFCWRSETPLLYKAVPSWFVRVEHMTSTLLANNDQSRWVPDYVREKRFGNWLRDARDWAISRNRYWGTPIPLWLSDDGEEIVCVGSIKELNELTGETITDLHRESIDHLTIPSVMGKGNLKRVSEVFDCWFESGSMPYAQVHYPFENKKDFEDCFPADFVAEGIDQTRGWFYTLLVLSTALFGKTPYKNLIVHGLVLASDGQKMSKRKQNYPDPMHIVNEFGADALRLYLINSPVVRGDNLRFKEEGVREILKDVFLPWYNAYRFFIQNVERLEREEVLKFLYNEDNVLQSDIMDKWIVSFTQSLLLFVKNEMTAYRLYTVVPRLIKFVDNLTNWYVRFNRKRLKGEGGKQDCQQALETLFGVLFAMIRIMAPFTPYLTELMYQNLKHLLDHKYDATENLDSVHYLLLPEPRQDLIDQKIERAVSRMQTVIELGRVIRDRNTLPIKYPLPEVVVIHKDKSCLDEMNSVRKYIMEELNVKVLTTTTDKEKYGVKMKAEPDHKVLGARLKGAFKAVMQEIKGLNDDQIQTFIQDKKINLLGHDLETDDLRIMYSVGGDNSSEMADKYKADADNDILVMLDVSPDKSMQDEGIAREVINRIQKLRKKAHLVPSNEVTVYYSVSPPTDDLNQVIQKFHGFIENVIKTPLRPLATVDQAKTIIQEAQQVKGTDLNLTIMQGFVKGWNETCADVPVKKLKLATDGGPFSKYVNIELHGLHPQNGATDRNAVVLLENPQGCQLLDYQGLMKQAQLVFGLQNNDIVLAESPRQVHKADKGLDVLSLHKVNIYAVRKQDLTKLKPSSQDNKMSESTPNCQFINVECTQRQGVAQRGTVLLENPRGNFPIDFGLFKKQVQKLFGLEENTFNLSLTSDMKQELSTNGKLGMLHGKTVFVQRK